MRKLSKKISMLMVLAMLVSLFSGVVSASAASSWSFYNKTADEIVEVKESIEMESNQFADFDLYKDGKAFDTDVYTVKYESSDEDVVWVDAKNGKLRADKYGKAEAGDKAVVSAKIENKNTGAKTTKSFTIVIAEEEVEVEYAIVSDMADEVYLTGEKYALKAVVTADGVATDDAVVLSIDGTAITEFAPTKAGDVTIVATATVDGEEITEKFVVTVEESVPEIVEAKQTSLNTVTVKFNKADWAKDFANKVKYSFVANGIDIDDIIKSAVAKDETVTITLYSNLVADTTYKFAYDGYDCVATITGAKSVPARIEVVGGAAVVGVETALDVKIFTADGVNITTDALKANVTYAGVDETISVVAGGKIYFFEAGKSAVVNATYEMGWDDNGNEIADLKATGTYYSVAAHTDSKLDGYAAAGLGAATDKLTYGNNITISLSDTSYVYAKYTRTPAQGTGNPYAIYVAPSSGYKYYSTNENVVMVNETTGQLVPCTQGVASVYIKDAQDAVVGSVTITVKEARKLYSFAPSMSDRMLSTGVVGFNDTIAVNVTTKDSLGAGYAASYGYALVNLTGNYTDYVTCTEADTNGDNIIDKITIAPSATAIDLIDDGKVKVVTLKITAFDVNDGNNKKEATVTFNIKDMQTVNVATTVLELSATSVDMKLNKNNVGEYNATAKLVKKDAAGYDLGLQAFNYITTDAEAATANGAYSVIIKKNADQNGQQQNALISSDGSTVTFAPVTDNGSVTKTEKATYTIKVFKGNGTKAQLYATRTISFTDSTSAITVVVNDNTVSATAAGALDFYRNGVKITDKITAVALKDVTTAVNGKVYVKSVTVTVDNKEMNNNFAGTHTEDVAVNALFGN